MEKQKILGWLAVVGLCLVGTGLLGLLGLIMWRFVVVFGAGNPAVIFGGCLLAGLIVFIVGMVLWEKSK